MTDSVAVDVAGLNVSRETLEALQAFEGLVQRWNSVINLVSKNTLPDLWHRHIVDSAQLFNLRGSAATKWADVGSGGGFPGIVVAILAKELAPELRVTLVESDLRKATFLRQAASALEIQAVVLSQRIEATEPQNADVVTARALAPLSTLLGYASLHMAPGGMAIFPKGARHAEELTEARKAWSFDVDMRPSLSDADAAILVIRNIKRVTN